MPDTYNGFDEKVRAASMLGDLQECRPWLKREREQAPIHQAVNAAILVCPPADLRALLLEYPHVADDDKKQIAYTRSELAGIANKQVMGPIGRYIKRHFPTIADHVLRDIVALHTPSEVTFKFVHTMPEIVQAVDEGPYSCMSGRYRSGGWEGGATDGVHPYEAYAPEHGWHMAIVQEGNQITGRALCNGKEYVRAYKWVSENNSTTDERLNAWLQSQGYSKEGGWAFGTRLKHIPLPRHHFVAPYIDGYNFNVVADGDVLVVVDKDVLDSGETYYECHNTSGNPDREEAGHSHHCEDCNEGLHEDDIVYVGRWEDRCVCEHCCDHNYTYAYTRSQNERYVESDDVIEVNGDYYDIEYLSDNNIVELADGDYACRDEACYIERLDQYHLVDDCTHCEHSNEYELSDDCVQLHDGEYAHTDDAWQCEHSDEWYLDEVDSMMTECGKTIHPAYAEHYTTETEGE